MDAEISEYDEEESKFHDYNYDDEYQEVQRAYNRNNDDNSSVSTYKKKQRKMLNQLNSLDKDHRVITIEVNYKKTDIEVYATNDYPGTVIKDAITGARCPPYKVGSLDEHLFFKAKLALNGMKANSDVFFFNSPEDYERLLNTVVTLDIKEKWTNRFVAARERNKV
jgi:hypothetical protein